MTANKMKGFNAKSFKDSISVAQQQTQDRFDKAEVFLGNSTTSQVQTAPLKYDKPESVSATQRQSLSVLKSEAELAEKFMQELQDVGFNPNISEIYRAGLQALASLSFEQRRKMIVSLERMRVGRPKK